MNTRLGPAFVAAAAVSLAAAPAALADEPTQPSIATTFTTRVSGLTVSYDYRDSGYQYAVFNHDEMQPLATDGGWLIDFGDGDGVPGAGADNIQDGVCVGPDVNPALIPFSTKTSGEHTYRTAGTYTVSVYSFFCDGGKKTLTKRYTVTVGESSKAGESTTPPAPVKPAQPAGRPLGPIVQTDRIASTSPSGVLTVGVAGAGAAAGLVIARRARLSA